jgi:retinol dehydrogenase 14
MTETSAGPMAGKTVLVTGGTSGIGRATAVGLAALGARVGITGRDQARTKTAAAEIAAETGNSQVDDFAADMLAQAQVRELAAAVLAAYPRLDVLVNNAGGFWSSRHVSADGIEQTFALNHLAPFLLTNLLLDRLKASAPARIVTVASAAHSTTKLRFDNLQSEKKYFSPRVYAQSKLANVMFTYELARRLEGSGVTATALHPGLVKTTFGQEDPSKLMNFIVLLGSPTAKSPEQGASTAVYLASAPEADGLTGQYFVNSKPKKSGKSSYDTTAAARLWQVSSDLVGLD